MKLQLDTTLKTIKVEENVKLSKFMDLVKKLLPNNEWKDFTLETNTTITHWSSPYIIEKIIEREKLYDPYLPHYPWYCTNSSTLDLKNADYTTKSGTGGTMCYLKSGTYNIEA